MLRRLGSVLWLEGDAEAATPLFERSLALAREGTDDYTIALCLESLSEAAIALAIATAQPSWPPTA